MSNTEKIICKMCGKTAVTKLQDGCCNNCRKVVRYRIGAGWATCDLYIEPGGRPKYKKALEPGLQRLAKFAIPKWRTSNDRKLAIQAFRASGPSVVGKAVVIRFQGVMTYWEPRVTQGVAYYELVGEVVQTRGLETWLGDR